MAENLNEFVASVFTVQNIGHVPKPQLLFSESKSEELSQIELTRDSYRPIQEILYGY